MLNKITWISLCGLFAAMAAFAQPPQVAKLTADDAAPSARFGFSVAVSGNTTIVGAYYDDDAGSESGSAYVFERGHGGTGNWGQVAKITADDAAAGDHFGVSVSISGDTAIVGATWDDDAGSNSGSAYVFERDQGGTGNWGQVAKLTADDAADGDSFGTVSVSGDTAIVGATMHDHTGRIHAGAAYVFERDHGGPDNWGQVTKITADDAATGDAFGTVSLSGDTAIVGAHGDDHAGGLNAGAAYVFERDHG
ncbi:MAG: hypothetical protein GY715_14450, partial [Planctomycetes bacterium]|nr:hypothetical protein [Planctomycetota bacterium]